MNKKPHTSGTSPDSGGVPLELRDANRQTGDDCFALPADPKLLAQGWVQRYLVAPDRIQESIDLYTSLGFEVQTRELSPDDFTTACTQCATEACRTYVMLYTRRKQADAHGRPA